jgi:L-lactate dehydrogenase (cytochrome)
MAGRAYLYGLGAGGEQGVDRVLEWFRADLVRTMSLVGAATIADLDRSLLDLPTEPETRS